MTKEYSKRFICSLFLFFVPLFNLYFQSIREKYSQMSSWVLLLYNRKQQYWITSTSVFYLMSEVHNLEQAILYASTSKIWTSQNDHTSKHMVFSKK